MTNATVERQKKTSARAPSRRPSKPGPTPPAPSHPCIGSSNHPPSVWSGNDADLLDWMISFYLRCEPTPIVDVTYGRGRFWKNSRYAPVLLKMDAVPSAPDVVQADFSNTGLPPGSVDVVVFDPPHISENATPNASQLVRAQMGFDSVERAADVNALFPGFVKEAYRILRKDGIALCKITDQVHRGKSRWQHIALMLEAEKAGLTACDMIVKIRKCALMGAWKRALHARKLHTFWIVLRRGKC